MFLTDSCYGKSFHLHCLLAHENCSGIISKSMCVYSICVTGEERVKHNASILLLSYNTLLPSCMDDNCSLSCMSTPGEYTRRPVPISSTPCPYDLLNGSFHTVLGLEYIPWGLSKRNIKEEY